MGSEKQWQPSQNASDLCCGRRSGSALSILTKQKAIFCEETLLDMT
jgi:hypothetical protein